MSRRVFVGYPAAGIDLDLRVSRDGDHESLEAAHIALGEIIPSDAPAALDWLLAQPRQTLLEILSVLIASAIDLSHEGATHEDARKQDIADRLAGALDLDMTQYWRPDMAFWSRLSKSALIDLLISTPCNAGLAEDQRAAFQKAQAKRTKDDIAQSVAKALEGSDWLPDLLITPKARGAFELTEAGCAVIAAE